MSPQEYVDVGAKLREARTRRGLSPDVLAQRTKIRTAMIRALEANRREDLPAPIFVRGFLRAYAREVGLDPEEMAREYFRQFEPVEPVESAEDPVAPPAGSPPAGSPSPGRDAPARAGIRGLTTAEQWLLIAALVSVSSVALTRWRAAGSSVAPVPSQPAAAASSASRVPAHSGTGTAGSGSMTATATQGRAVHVEIRATGPCWVSATVDGTRTLYETMQPGERRVFDLSDEAVLRVGNPAAFNFSIAGTPGRSLGPPGRPVTVRITKDNYREFVQP